MVRKRLLIGASTTAALVALSPMFAPLAMAGVSLSLTSSAASVQAGQATQFTIQASGTSGLSTSDSYSYHVYMTDGNGVVMSDFPFTQPTVGSSPMQTTPTTVTDMVYGAQTVTPGTITTSYPFLTSTPSGAASLGSSVTGEVYGSFSANLSASTGFTLTPTDFGAYNVWAELYDNTTNTTVASAVYTPLTVTAPTAPTLTLTPSTTGVTAQLMSQWSLSLPSGLDPSQMYYQLQVTNADGTPTKAPVSFYLMGSSSQAQIPATISPTETIFTDDTLTTADTSLPLGMLFSQAGSYQVTAAVINKTTGAVAGLATQTVSVTAANLTGTLESAGGTPIPYASFDLSSGGQSAGTANTDANGNFSASLSPGTYQVSNIWTNDGRIDNLSTPITFTVTSTSTTQALVVPNLHVATLVAADGKTPMANTYFDMTSPTDSTYDIHVQTWPDGKFILPFSAGNYQIANVRDQYGQETLNSPIAFTVSTTTPTPTVADAAANVTGTVYLDSAKTKPASHGQLQIVPAATATSSSPSATTLELGAGGTFAISLPQGSYEIQGLSDSQSDWQMFPTAQKLTVGTGVTSVTVAPPVKDAHFIVNNPDGTPVTSGEIAVLTAADYSAGNWNNAQWLQVTNGTVDGQLPTGNYVVGGLSTSTWAQLDIPFSVDATASQPVNVTVQPPANNVQFTVNDAQGQAVTQGDLVVLSQTDYTNQNWKNAYNFNVTSGSAGGYLPTGGTYVVVGVSSDTGWTPLDMTFSVPSTLAAGATVNETVAPAAPNVDFHVTTDGTTAVSSGQMTIISAADLKAGNWANAVPAQVTNGVATSALAPGDYVATYLSTQTQSYQLSVPFTVATTATSQNPLTVNVAPQQPKVQGVVVDAQGKPVTYATLMILPSGSTDESQAIYLPTDGTGHFTDLQVQPDGTMTDALVPGQAYTLYGVWNQSGTWTQFNSPFDTTAADQPITITLPGPDLSGTVTVNGRSVTSGYIAIGPANSSSWADVAWASISGGQYSISLPTGQYVVYGIQDNDTNSFVNTQSLSSSFSVDATKSNTFNFGYTPNLSGTVTKNGVGVPYATVMLSPNQDPNSTKDGWNQVEYVTTDSKGNFDANVPQGSTWYIVGVYGQDGTYDQLDEAVQANPSTPVTVDLTPTVTGAVTWNQSPEQAWVVVEDTQSKQTYTASLSEKSDAWSYGLSLGAGSYQILGITTQSDKGTENWIDLSTSGLNFNVASSRSPVNVPINLTTSYSGQVSGNNGQAGYVVFSNASTGKLLSISFDTSGDFTTLFDGSAGWSVKGIETAANGYQAASGQFTNNTWTAAVE